MAIRFEHDIQGDVLIINFDHMLSCSVLTLRYFEQTRLEASRGIVRF